MLLQNPYTKGYIEYPLAFSPDRYSYHICHDTPFSEYHSEWAVYIIENGDMIYIPYGNNRCRNVYVVTWAYTSRQVERPYGIYILPMAYFTTPNNEF